MIRLLHRTARIAGRLTSSSPQILRSLSLSHRLCLKEIRVSEEGDTKYFEGVYVKSPREGRVINTENEKGACPLCSLGLSVKHTDVLIIKQFVDDFGQLLPRHITGLCRFQQRHMKYVLEMAVRAGLVKALLPPDEKIPVYQQGWRCFNSYYDEDLIPPSKSEIALQRNKLFEEAYQIAKAEKDEYEEKLKSRSTRKEINRK